MKKKLILPLLLCCLFMAKSTGKSLPVDQYPNLIIGRWYVYMNRNHDITETYQNDGEYILDADGDHSKGHWKIQGDQLTITFDKPFGGNQPSPEKVQFITKDEFMKGEEPIIEHCTRMQK